MRTVLQFRTSFRDRANFEISRRDRVAAEIFPNGLDIALRLLLLLPIVSFFIWFEPKADRAFYAIAAAMGSFWGWQAFCRMCDQYFYKRYLNGIAGVYDYTISLEEDYLMTEHLEVKIDFPLHFFSDAFDLDNAVVINFRDRGMCRIPFEAFDSIDHRRQFVKLIASKKQKE